LPKFPIFENTIKIGTRGSLLAITQATQTKDRLSELTGNRFELVPIKTEGDIKTDKPLWQLEGENFFTKELDSALEKEEVDMVIHSYKDLGSIRPPFCELASITKRDYAHDILLIKRDTIPKISKLDKFVIGTSSPRRINNLEKYFVDFLPNPKINIKIETKMLRGNVNTRIEKLLRGDYHAICLAFPGLERLALSDKSRAVLKKLLKDVTFMILPQSTFPSAASQGALAIEVSKKHPRVNDLKKNLRSIHDEITATEIKIERELFNSYGGGCHLAVGINAKKKDDFFIINERGINYQNELISKTTLQGGKLPKKNSSVIEYVFIGLQSDKNMQNKTNLTIVSDELLKKTPINNNQMKELSGNIVISSTYSADAININRPKINSLFSSGTKTLIHLAKRGFWVNGCFDSIGDLNLLSFKNSKLLPIMEPSISNNNWLFFTNSSSKIPFGKVIPAYKRELVKIDSEFETNLKKCTYFYWTSFAQFSAYREKYNNLINSNDVIHCCGIGKTLTEFNLSEINVYPFISSKDFLTFLNS
jgi:hydroxymethylbilane synthase